MSISKTEMKAIHTRMDRNIGLAQKRLGLAGVDTKDLKSLATHYAKARQSYEVLLEDLSSLKKTYGSRGFKKFIGKVFRTKSYKLEKQINNSIKIVNSQIRFLIDKNVGLWKKVETEKRLLPLHSGIVSVLSRREGIKKLQDEVNDIKEELHGAKKGFNMIKIGVELKEKKHARQAKVREQAILKAKEARNAIKDQMVTVDDFLVKLVNEQNDSDKKFKEARDQFQKEVGVHTFGGAPRELKAEHKKALSELNETRERIQGQINDARALRKDLKGKLRELRANKPVKMTQKSVNKTNIDIGKAKVEEVKGRLDAAKARLNAAKAEHDVIAHQFHINTFDTALLVKLAKDVEGKIKALHGLDS